MRVLAAAVLAFALLAGCTEDGAAPQRPGDGAGAAIEPLVLSEPVRVEGRLTREPAIVQTPTGTLFVGGYAYGTVQAVGPVPLVRPDLTAPPVLWSSTDDGASWSLVEVGTPVPDAAFGNSDVDLAVGPDGTIYFATMTFSRVGHTIAVGASSDDGASWRWSILSLQPLVDRPWVDVAPDGTVHVVWNDGRTVHHARSSDGAATWTETPPVHEPGGDGGLAVGPKGEVAVRIIPRSGSGYTTYAGEDGLAVSTDSGDSWAFKTVPGDRTYCAFTDEVCDTPRWADPVAFDAGGTLYTAWGEDDRLLLARTRDLGDAWNVTTLSTQEGLAVWYPWLRAGPVAGELAVTWFGFADGDLTAHVAIVTGADTDAPSVRTASFVPDTGGGTGGEYFQSVFLAGGGVGFATTVQTPGDADGADAGTGFEYRVAR